eukprot:2560687-Prymnesium_polylepis.1
MASHAHLDNEAGRLVAKFGSRPRHFTSTAGTGDCVGGRPRILRSSRTASRALRLTWLGAQEPCCRVTRPARRPREQGDRRAWKAKICTTVHRSVSSPQRVAQYPNASKNFPVGRWDGFCGATAAKQMATSKPDAALRKVSLSVPAGASTRGSFMCGTRAPEQMASSTQDAALRKLSLLVPVEGSTRGSGGLLVLLSTLTNGGGAACCHLSHRPRQRAVQQDAATVQQSGSGEQSQRKTSGGCSCLAEDSGTSVTWDFMRKSSETNATDRKLSGSGSRRQLSKRMQRLSHSIAESSTAYARQMEMAMVIVLLVFTFADTITDGILAGTLITQGGERTAFGWGSVVIIGVSHTIQALVMVTGGARLLTKDVLLSFLGLGRILAAYRFFTTKEGDEPNRVRYSRSKYRTRTAQIMLLGRLKAAEVIFEALPECFLQQLLLLRTSRDEWTLIQGTSLL